MPKATNSHLFGGNKKPSQPPYKRVEVMTLATTVCILGKHTAVVLVRKGNLKVYNAMLFEGFAKRIDALQRAHYINANMVMRTGDPLPPYLTGGDATVAAFKEQGYSL